VREHAEREGIKHATAGDPRRLDRGRGAKVSNRDRTSPVDPQARSVKMKDGRTHLASEAANALDVDSQILNAAKVNPADCGDAKTPRDVVARAQSYFELAQTYISIEEDVAESW
jgi:hypothetical protein